MSLPATPTGSRRRHTGNQAGGWGGRESPTPGGASAGWLGQLGGIVGDILQGWGLLGALRRSGNGNKSSSSPSYGWGSFGGVGSGLGAVGGLGCYSSPASPLVSTRGNSLHMSGGEHIELLPLTGQCVSSAEAGAKAAASRASLSDASTSVVKLRHESCPKHRSRRARHSYHEGSTANSYLLTAVLMHSLKHGAGQTCRPQANCHICNNVPYEQLEKLMAGKKLDIEDLMRNPQPMPGVIERSNKSIEVAGCRNSCASVDSVPSSALSSSSAGLEYRDYMNSEKSSQKPLITSTEEEFSDSCASPISSRHLESSKSMITSSTETEAHECLLYESDSVGFSDISFYTARDGTLNCSTAEESYSGLDPLVSSQSLTDGQTDTYPADTLTDGSDDSDDTLYGHDEEDEARSNETDTKPYSNPSRRPSMKYRNRESFPLGSSNYPKENAKKSRHSVCTSHPAYRSVASLDGTVNSGSRSSSLSSLAPLGRPFLVAKADEAGSRALSRSTTEADDGESARLRHRKCCVVSGVQGSSGGAVIMWPLRRSCSTSPTQTCFGWEENHQLGRLVSESACEREDPGSNPAADMVDAARNTAWDLGKQPNNYRSNYPTQEWARRTHATCVSRVLARAGQDISSVRRVCWLPPAGVTRVLTSSSRPPSPAPVSRFFCSDIHNCDVSTCSVGGTCVSKSESESERCQLILWEDRSELGSVARVAAVRGGAAVVCGAITRSLSSVAVPPHCEYDITSF
ncbi:hypothetical protein FHG87_005390 [Trinorchestia longiramus]|nr:hypothetical protein FHG87_005390 [Trinorchestia longiramus]